MRSTCYITQTSLKSHWEAQADVTMKVVPDDTNRERDFWNKAITH